MGMPLTHRRFTVDEYHRMADAGILTEDDRVELIDGEIVEMSPIGDRHVACVVRISDGFAFRARDTAVVSVQNPLRLGRRDEPQPDLVLLRRRDLSGAWAPTSRDALLVIEVAETSVQYDRHRKLPIYAHSGIPECWLVNLPEDVIEVYREPQAGSWSIREIVRRGDTLTPLALPSVTLSADEILG